MDTIQTIKFNKIHYLASLIRNEVQQEYGEDVTGLCAHCSNILYSRLTFEFPFLDIKVIKGTFNIDNPNPEYYTGYEKENRCIYHPTHYWLEVEGHIVDITADQFNDEIEDERMVNIVIGTYEDLPRYEKK